jgi:hypothetical protein
MKLMSMFVGVLLLSIVGLAQVTNPTLYVEPTSEGFEVYVAAAMTKKKVPVTVMTKADGATYTLKTAAIEEEIVSTGRKVVNCLFASCGGNENKASTSVQLIDGSGAIVWSYSVNKGRGSKNRQSMAESIAEHLKDDYLKDLR